MSKCFRKDRSQNSTYDARSTFGVVTVSYERVAWYQIVLRLHKLTLQLALGAHAVLQLVKISEPVVACHKHSAPLRRHIIGKHSVGVPSVTATIGRNTNTNAHRLCYIGLSNYEEINVVSQCANHPHAMIYFVTCLSTFDYLLHVSNPRYDSVDWVPRTCSLAHCQRMRMCVIRVCDVPHAIHHKYLRRKATRID